MCAIGCVQKKQTGDCPLALVVSFCLTHNVAHHAVYEQSEPDVLQLFTRLHEYRLLICFLFYDRGPLFLVTSNTYNNRTSCKNLKICERSFPLKQVECCATSQLPDHGVHTFL